MPVYTLNEMMKQTTARAVAHQGAMDVSEDAEGYTVKMIVPGIAPEHIEITVTGRTLEIKAEAPERSTEGEIRQHMREFVIGRVARRIEFPLPVDADGVTAQGVHGVLIVRVPKSAAAQPKRISVTTPHQHDA